MPQQQPNGPSNQEFVAKYRQHIQMAAATLGVEHRLTPAEIKDLQVAVCIGIQENIPPAERLMVRHVRKTINAMCQAGAEKLKPRKKASREKGSK